MTSKTINVTIQRGSDEDSQGIYLQSFDMPSYTSQTVLDVVSSVQQNADPTLSYRFACKSMTGKKLSTTESAGGKIVPILLMIALSGCNSSSDGGDENNPAASNDTGTPDISTSAVRVKTKTVDSFINTSRDESQVYEYDDAGRIAMRSLSSPSQGATQVIVYDYDTAGNLLSKSDGTTTDSYTYDNGHLTSAQRSANGQLSYVYDDQGRLSNLSGEGFYFDDDCADPIPSLGGGFETPVTPAMQVSYADGEIATITDTVNDNITNLTRDSAGRLERVVHTGKCYEFEPQSDVYVYDDQGKPVSALQQGTGSRAIRSVRRAYVGDRLSTLTVEKFDEFTGAMLDTVMITVVYDEQNQIESEQTSRDGVVIGQVSYTYEQESCVQAGSADPSMATQAEVAALFSVRSPALLCGYWFDENDF